MNKQQRKRHFRTWVLLAILLPLGIIAARIAVPEKTTDKLLQTPATDPNLYIKPALTVKPNTDTLNNNQ